jgi:hypothetical protein
MDKQLKKFLEELESEEVEVFKIIRVEKKAENEKMVLCSKCGCHIPMSESLTTDNQITCNNPDCTKPE